MTIFPRLYLEKNEFLLFTKTSARADLQQKCTELLLVPKLRTAAANPEHTAQWADLPGDFPIQPSPQHMKALTKHGHIIHQVVFFSLINGLLLRPLKTMGMTTKSGEVFPFAKENNTLTLNAMFK